MALLASDVISASVIDIRQTFRTADVNTFFLSWVDRVQKDILHTSPVWSPRLHTKGSFLSTSGVTSYPISSTDVRQIKQVFDAANRNQLIPYTELNYTAATSIPDEREGQPNNRNIQAQQTSTMYPRFYNVEIAVDVDGVATTTIHIFPDPKTSAYAGTIQYFYSKYAPTVATVGDTLIIPEDGKDIMVAGVNMYAARFQLMPSEAALWRDIYEGMKKG